MKKYLAMILTFVMLFSLTIPAMAETATDNNSHDVSASYTPTYTITIDSSIVNGSVSVQDNLTAATAGTTVTLTVTPAEGYELDTLTVTDADSTPVTVENNQFTMPAKAVTVTATFKEVDGPTYKITIAESIENGKVESDKTEAKEGDSVALTITPAEGYELETLTVGDGDVTADVQEGKYTFTMGKANVEVTATFKKITYTITIDSPIVNGTVTAPATATMGETVTLTVTPDAKYELGSITVTDANSDPVTVTDKTFTMPASNVTVTATFTELPITSVSITWGSMSFVYDDTIDETTNAEKGWTYAAGANLVTVTNGDESAITASVEYKQATGYEAINGYFADKSATASADLNLNASHAFTLTLDGKPEGAITAGTTIGSVIVTIDETEIVTVVTTRADLVNAMNAGGTVKMGSDMTNNLLSNSLTSPAVLDLNGYTYTNIWYGSATKSLQFNSKITIKDSIGTGGIACEDDCLYALYLGSTSSDVTVYGGTYSSNQWAARVYQGTLTIYGGTFNGGDSSLVVGGTTSGATVKIYGGTFTGGISKQSGPLTIEIYGGTFSFDPSDYVDLTNYTVTKSDGTWTVTAK